MMLTDYGGLVLMNPEVNRLDDNWEGGKID